MALENLIGSSTIGQIFCRTCPTKARVKDDLSKHLHFPFLHFRSRPVTASIPPSAPIQAGFVPWLSHHLRSAPRKRQSSTTPGSISFPPILQRTRTMLKDCESSWHRFEKKVANATSPRVGTSSGSGSGKASNGSEVAACFRPLVLSKCPLVAS